MKGVERRKLSNGLTVLLCPDHRLPLACALTWVRAGYFDEPDENVGISHVIEHMFFKGTPTRAGSEIARQTKLLGGYLNAATIYDHTYYYTVLPSKNLVPAIDIQADALMHPLFDAGELDKEKEVVIEELKRKYDSPNPFAWEKLLELAFEKHRIRRWRMGKEENIRKLTRDDVVGYYERYYAPGNIILVVAGDFEPGALFPEIERRYGEMPAREVERNRSPEEPLQAAPKMVRLNGDIVQPLLKMGFHVPPTNHPDYYATIALSILLGRGRSSRLYRSIKEEKGIVDAVGVSLYTSRDVGFLAIEADLKPENLPLCEEEIWVELDRIRKDPPTAEEIAKIRSVVEVNFFSEKEDVMGQAYGLAFFEDLGGYEQVLEYVNRMRSVTSSDILRVLEKYFTFPNMSLIEYVPNRLGEGAPIEARLESLEKRVGRRWEKETAAPAPEIPAVPPFVFSSFDTRPLTQSLETIDLGGATLLHLHNPALPLVSAAVYFPGGRLDETEGNCGVTQFMLRSTLKGTEHRSADEIAFEMESLGSSIAVESTADLFGYSMSLLSRDFDKGLDLLSDVVTRPAFPDTEVEKERQTITAAVRRSRDDMFRYPIELFYRSMFGLHPYGLPRNGTEESIGRITRSDLTDWYSEAFQWRKMVVTVAGDIDRNRAVSVVREKFGVSGDRDDEPKAQLYPVVPARGVREAVEERERQQTGVALGFAGVPIRDDRYFALEVLRNVLAGMGGRFFRALREEAPLVYTATAFNISLLRGGAFFTYIATSREKENEARARLLSELMNVRERRVPEDELKAAKAYCIGSHAMSLQGNLPVAYAYLHHIIAGRGPEGIAEYESRIESVTADSVCQTARDILNPEQYASGIVRGRS
ncbi:MAG: pitrilysin family protein [Pseudomonadota bacterium]